MRFKRFFFISLIALTALVLIVSVLHGINKRREHKLLYDFPETGYTASNPYLDASVKITIRTEDGEPFGIRVRVRLDHKDGAEPLKHAVPAAKLHDDIAAMLWTRLPYVNSRYERFDFGDDGHGGLTFGLSTGFDPELDIGTTKDVLEILDRPVWLKISHSLGVELIEVTPQLTAAEEIEE